MNALLFFAGGLVIFIFLFKRELLIEKESFRLILAVSIALCLTGVVLHFTEPPTAHAPKQCHKFFDGVMTSDGVLSS